MTLHSETQIYRAVIDLQRFVMGAAVNMRRDVKPPLGGEWFDEQRLKVTRERELVLDNHRTPGPDLEAPKR